MKKNVKEWFVLLFLIAVVGCGRESNESTISKNTQTKKNESLTPLVNVPHSNQAQITKASYTTQERTPDGKVVTTTKYPESIAVFVNKKIYLPHTYIPRDLVFPKVSFIFKEYIDKRKMRKEAAIALEKMFAAAKKEGIYLSGASGNSANFGYIIRYPKGKEYITGYKYEPWHIRYVGTGISKDMKARGLTLEEYFGISPVLK